MDQVSVTAEGLTRRYGTFTAVDGIDLNVAPGELLTLLGPSGCGKTTTLRMIAGLERASEGRLSIAERVVDEPARGTFITPERRGLGMVFQSYAIWPHMTVFDNVAYPLSIRRRPKAEIAERVAKTLNLIEMAHLADRPATDLSGGQQQRIAIARALVFEPQVLLLDEPMSNLDARLRTQMGDDFRELQQRFGMTAIYVTHDQAEAMSLSDRVAVMHGGRILQIGSPEEIYHRPTQLEVARFFGNPNLFVGRVTSSRKIGDSLFEVSVEDGGARGTARTAHAFGPGDSVQILVRPEDLRFADHAEGHAFGWAGQVVNAIFRGPNRSISVETHAGVLRVEAPSRVSVRAGDNVCICADGDAAWAVPAA